MDIHDLKRKVQAAREFHVDVDGGVQFVLRLPTEHERLLTADRARQQGMPARGMLRNLLQAAVVGWVGLCMEHLLPNTDEPGPLPFDADLAPELVPLVFDAQPAWEAALLDAFLDRLMVRQAPIEEAAKN